MRDPGLSKTSYRWLVAAALAPMLAGPSACANGPGSGAASVAGTEPAVTLESVAGSPIKRVVLSKKAAERLDVRTGAVEETTIEPTQMVGGIVVDPSAAGDTASEETGASEGQGGKSSARVWIRVALSAPEWERLAKEKPVRVFPLETRASLDKDLIATPTGEPPKDNAKSGMLTLFFIVPPGGGGLVPSNRVRVELQFEGGTEKQKVVPYSAVYYDAKGEAWVYVHTASHSFLRERITVDRVSGDLALLSSGPAVATPIATLGVSLLYGAEIFGK